MKISLSVEIFRAYALLLWFLGGALLLTLVITSPKVISTPIMMWSADVPFWVYAPIAFVMAFCSLPLVVVLIPINAVPMQLHFKNYGAAAIELLIPVVFYFLWWLVWYALYGRWRKQERAIA